MSETIEGLHGQILEKMQYVETIFEQISALRAMLDSIGVNYEDMFNRAFIHVNIAIEEIKDLKEKYNLDVLHVLSAYYSSVSAGNNDELRSILHSSFEDGYVSEEHLSKEYFKILRANNYSQDLDRFLKRAKTSVDILLRKYAKIKFAQAAGINIDGYSLTETIKLIPIMDPIYVIAKRIINNISIAESFKVDNKDIPQYREETDIGDLCECGGVMYIKSSTSELVCSECSRLRTIYGTASDESSVNSDGNKPKQSSYDYLRHFKLWIQRIQAKSKKTIKETELQKLKNIMVDDGIRLLDLNVEKMREILKKAELTKYNDDCPYLIFYFTGYSPPELSQTELKLFQVKFMRIMEMRQILKEKDGNADGNRPYYPYYIYKIAEIIFKGNAEKLKILDYIHLQSDDTLKKNDNEFEEIVAMSKEEDGIWYSPTRRR
jgi:hypothetical protein